MTRNQPEPVRLTDLRTDVAAISDAERARTNAWFFKTGPGQYGEGDQFAGLTLPQVHSLSKKYRSLSLDDCRELLHAPIHEERLLALDILVDQFKKADLATRQTIHELYLANTAWVNNWDLVDCSAERIVGSYLEGRPRDVLDRLASSESVWDRRIAMIATFHFTRNGDPGPALRIAAALVDDKHDLLHKATGWMLREVGKRCGRNYLTAFLDQHGATMPRTALRYAIEQFAPEERQHYMALKANLRKAHSGQ